MASLAISCGRDGCRLALRRVWEAPQSMLEPRYEFGNEDQECRERSLEAALEEIEQRIDDILKSELARNANGGPTAPLWTR
jgi:hypothetical protein